MMMFDRPGKPVDNTYIESFNGRLRDECMNANWFLRYDHTREVIGQWQKYFNSIGHMAHPTGRRQMSLLFSYRPGDV